MMQPMVMGAEADEVRRIGRSAVFPVLVDGEFAVREGLADHR
jgi:hypothetical protein